MGRLFTFGCSFTKYTWPTWADLLGLEFDEFENWGVSGGGNVCTANRVIECIIKNNVNGFLFNIEKNNILNFSN